MLRITRTESGMVRGLPGTDARITAFKGIPYAADTSGENRWRAPQPAPCWEGVRECFEFAPISMQKVPGGDPNNLYSKEWNVEPEILMGEDSLALNIWTNAKTGDEKMPVYVWIYGGGLQSGYGHEMEFDGERIASRGVVCVTIGYRLNIFGFLAHPDLTAEDPEHPTNFGFLDQQAAIAWVKRNIANFGGDPDNITIGGQSSGGVSVFSQMCAPSSKGLFQRAIIQSSAGGSVFSRYPKNTFRPLETLAVNEEIGKKFLKEVLGCDTIAEARKLDAFYIRDKMVEVGGRFPNSVDGKFMTMDVDGYLFSNQLHDIPFMLGWTGDEFFYVPEGDTIEEIEAWAADKFGDHAGELLAIWRKKYGDSAEALKANVKVNVNEISARFVAEEAAAQGKDVYVYGFDPEIPGDDAGAFHSCDLWFTFETLMKCWRPFDGHHYDLARKMCNYWTNFIKTGDPNGLDHDGTPMPTWTKYSKEDPTAMMFFDEVYMEDALTEQERCLVDANLKSYKG